MKSVLFITNIPSPYRVNFFDTLGKSMDVTVLYSECDRDHSGRAKDWYIHAEGYFRPVQLTKRIASIGGEILCRDVIDWVKKPFDAIVVCGYSSPTMMLAMAYMRLHKIPFYMEVDGGLIRPDSRLKFLFKKLLVSMPNDWISSGEHTSRYLVHYGAEESRIHHYPFTSLWASDIAENIPEEEEKLQLRRELGMTEEKIVISVSRFIPSKRLDMLIRSGAALGETVGIYLIGGEPTEEYLQLQKELDAKNVHFAGFTKKDRLALYYRAADLFVLPTQTDVWGLVINEAMACGLPIITTDWCVAGLELVKDGINGYLIPKDDQQALDEKIRAVFRSDYRKMGEAALEAIRPYTIENMAKAHVEIFK